MKQILFRLPEDLKKELKITATVKGLSISQLLNQIIEAYLEKNSEQVA